jgi:hypothetical protein
MEPTVGTGYVFTALGRALTTPRPLLSAYPWQDGNACPGGQEVHGHPCHDRPFAEALPHFYGREVPELPVEPSAWTDAS